jgi:hypothetical protein
MGGKALKNINCVRVNLELYNKIKSIILSKLLPYNYFVSIIEMPGKETFGDLDLIYKWKDNQDIPFIINELFSPREVFSNNNVFSFSYNINEVEYFQIDLIKVSNIEMAQFYYGYGDIGHIIGRMMKKNDLTFGAEGLWINYENNKIMLSSDPLEICNFIGLDHSKWKNGFNTITDVFNWIIQCKYFNKIYFNPDNFNAVYKKNYETRPNFKLFVDYILNINTENKNEINLNIIDYITIFNKHNEKEIIDKKLYINKLHQEKFSGKIFLLYTDCKNIGKYKDAFKKHICENQDFNEYLLNNDIDFINNQIKDFILNNVL